MNTHTPSHPARVGVGSLRVSKQRRWLLGLCFALLLLTGIAWLVANFGIDDPEQQAPWLNWSMRLHGAGVIGSIFLLGALWTLHIRHAWLRRRNRAAGAVFLACALLLVLTGYGLYYFNGERLRDITQWGHWVAGGLLGILFLVHLLAGRAEREEKPV